MSAPRVLPHAARLLSLALAWLLAWTGSASAQAAAEPTEVPVAAHGDSGAKVNRMVGTGAYQRLLAEADSVLKLRGGVHAEKAQLYLTWNAPWGMKRAVRTRLPACNDTTSADTLYLSFFPGRGSDHFAGFTGELLFHATGQDTLGPWWHMESKGGENGGNIMIDWGPADDIPGRQPWPSQGRGFAMLDRTPGLMRLRLLYAMSLNDAGPLDSTVTYTLCRVIVRHHNALALAGCGRPVAVEWSKATFGFALKDEPEVRRGERFVSYAGPYTICEPFHDQPSAKAWKPPAATAKPPGSK
jgi:hypothetical protein